MTTQIESELGSGVFPRINLTRDASDGTRLVFDAYVPDTAHGPVPVVITRTPYGRSAHRSEGAGWNALGLGYVVEDVRGRYDSDGRWSPYHHERADGAELVDAILAEPWCDGRVIGYGGSYSGYTAWAMAVERPGAMAGVVSLGPSMSLRETKFDPAGVLRLAEHAAWWLERGDARTSRDGLAAATFAARPRLLSRLPVSAVAESLDALLPSFNDLLVPGLPPRDREAITDEELSTLTCAALHVGGWYDLLTPHSFAHQRTVGSKALETPPQTMIIGPWGHDLAFTRTSILGDRDHGVRSTVDFSAVLTRWLDATLVSNRRTDRAETSHVYVIGADQWLTCAQWPPPTTTVRYVTSAGGLHSDTGGERGSTQFCYDPLDPFPSFSPGADRAISLTREDAACFTTAPQAEPLVVLGTPTVDVVGSSTAPTVDWIARLLELDADGRFFEITTGVAVVSGGSDLHRIVLRECAYRIDRGSRLVLEITTSDFPHLARNLNGSDRYRTERTRRAVQTVHYGPESTALTLPVHQDVLGEGAIA